MYNTLHCTNIYKIKPKTENMLGDDDDDDDDY